MKDYSNYHSNSSEKIRNDAKVVASATFRGLESENALINGDIETVVYIYDKYSGTESLKYLIDENEWLTYGDVVHRSNGEKWLVRTYEKDNPLFKQWVAKMCQYTLKWYDENSLLHEYPCILEYNTKSNFGEKGDRVMVLPDGRRQVVLRKDENTMKISRAKRFVIGREVFEVIDNDFVSDIGLVNLSLQSTQTNPARDNIELGIADYYYHQHKYELSIPYDNNSLTVSINQPFQLDIRASKDGQAVSINEIILSSTDEEIGNIDKNGLFTPLQVGVVDVVAEYMGITKSVKIVVDNIYMDNYTVEILGGDSINLGQSKEFSVVIKNNGNTVSETFDVSLFADDGINHTVLATIIKVDTYGFTLKANSNSKIGFIRIKINSTNNLFETEFRIRVKSLL